MKKPNILDTPIDVVQEDTAVEQAVITNIEKSKRKIDPHIQFVNKYYKLSLPQYKVKVEELYPESMESY